MQFSPVIGRPTAPENTVEIPDPIPDRVSVLAHPLDGWLCPIPSEYGRRGILHMTAAEYFDLVDKSGRMTRSDKPKTTIVHRFKPHGLPSCARRAQR